MKTQLDETGAFVLAAAIIKQAHKDSRLKGTSPTVRDDAKDFLAWLQANAKDGTRWQALAGKRNKRGQLPRY